MEWNTLRICCQHFGLLRLFWNIWINVFTSAFHLIAYGCIWFCVRNQMAFCIQRDIINKHQRDRASVWVSTCMKERTSVATRITSVQNSNGQIINENRERIDRLQVYAYLKFFCFFYSTFLLCLLVLSSCILLFVSFIFTFSRHI